MRINAGARAQRALVQPVHGRPEGGERRARPEGAGGSRRLRPRRSSARSSSRPRPRSPNSHRAVRELFLPAGGLLRRSARRCTPMFCRRLAMSDSAGRRHRTRSPRGTFPLRLLGGLHYLVLAGDASWDDVDAALLADHARLPRSLDGGAGRADERGATGVGRSCRHPSRSSTVARSTCSSSGPSGGLNLLWDRYSLRGIRRGSWLNGVALRSEATTVMPPPAELLSRSGWTVARRRGVDLKPDRRDERRRRPDPAGVRLGWTSKPVAVEATLTELASAGSSRVEVASDGSGRKWSARTRFFKTKVASLLVFGTLVGTTGLAAAGALPAPIQDVASKVLAKVGISVPMSDGHPANSAGEISTTALRRKQPASIMAPRSAPPRARGTARPGRTARRGRTGRRAEREGGSERQGVASPRRPHTPERHQREIRRGAREPRPPDERARQGCGRSSLPFRPLARETLDSGSRATGRPLSARIDPRFSDRPPEPSAS